LSAGDELFQLAHGLVAGEREPGVFGLGGGDAGEFAHGRPVELAAFESRAEGGEGFEGLGDAQLFLGGARFVAEQSFDVFGEAAEAEVEVRGGAQGREQGAAFFGVGEGAGPGEA
jgi:hypothetical protein